MPAGRTARELAATMVVALDLTEASVKVRTGPPVRRPGGTTRWDVWGRGGAAAVGGGWRARVPDNTGVPHLPVPAYAAQYRRPATATATD